LLYLQTVGRTTTAAAARFLGETRRVALRDLKQLEEVAPLTTKGTGRDKVWALDPLEGRLNVALADRIGLYIGQQTSGFLAGTFLARVYAELSPVEASASPRFSSNLGRKIRVKCEPGRSYTGCDDVLNDVLTALLQTRRLDLVYAGRRGLRSFDGFRPLTLVVYRRALYLLGWNSAGDVRRLALERIQSSEAADVFDYPPEWNPDAELDPWFGMFSADGVDQVVLDFAPKAADYVIRRDWHESARTARLPDGGVRLEMKTGGQELVRFVLEWGPMCKAVAPGWLVDAVRDELQAALEHYRPVAERQPQASAERVASSPDDLKRASNRD